MKVRYFMGMMIILALVSCRTKKETIVNQPPPQQPQQKKELTEEERNKLVQMEYKPEEQQKPLTPEAKKSLEALAMEKANLMCKKINLQKRIDAGEEVDPNEMLSIDTSLAELEKREMKYTHIPAFKQYFEEKFSEYFSLCSK